MLYQFPLHKDICTGHFLLILLYCIFASFLWLHKSHSQVRIFVAFLSFTEKTALCATATIPTTSFLCQWSLPQHIAKIILVLYKIPSISPRYDTYKLQSLEKSYILSLLIAMRKLHIKHVLAQVVLKTKWMC